MVIYVFTSLMSKLWLRVFLMGASLSIGSCVIAKSSWKNYQISKDASIQSNKRFKDTLIKEHSQGRFDEECRLFDQDMEILDKIANEHF
jgi:hypothetical protein